MSWLSARAFFLLLRPYQWVKNCFVFAGILFVSPKTEIDFINVAYGFAAFCAASSAVYVINDVVDVAADKLHSTKCNRPIAAGLITKREAFWIQLLLAVMAGAIAWQIGRRAFGLIMLYLALNIAYSFWLKRIVLVDVFAISCGFMLRIMMGTNAIGIPASHWLFVTGFMLTLFLGFCKRQADPSEAWMWMETRFQAEHLVAITAAGTIICYALFTMAPDTIAYHHTEYLFTTVPFVAYGIMRYLMLAGDDAASHLFRDTHLIVVGLGWIGLTSYLCWS